MTSHRSLTVSVVSIALIAIAAGCQASIRNSEVPTLTVSALARDLDGGPASFKGQIVRVCRGRLTRLDPPTRREWQFAALGESFRHGAGVRVKPCGDAAPSLDSQGCLQGRIARADGSMAEPAPDESVLVASAIVSFVWYLHAQCPAAG
jgi:hypothetical protein